MSKNSIPDSPASDDPVPEPDTPDPPAAAPVAAPAPSDPPVGTAAERLRAEYAEIAAVTAQAARLGVVIDAADVMARGVAPHALRRSILDTLAARSEANAVVAIAPQPAAAGDSPIVRRARERASANRT